MPRPTPHTSLDNGLMTSEVGLALQEFWDSLSTADKLAFRNGVSSGSVFVFTPTS